jgi:hypothetical protein
VDVTQTNDIELLALTTLEYNIAALLTVILELLPKLFITNVTPVTLPDGVTVIVVIPSVQIMTQFLLIFIEVDGVVIIW